MTREQAEDRTEREAIRRWHGRFIDAREAQHLQELIRRGAAGEFTRDELTAELGRVLAQLAPREWSER